MFADAPSPGGPSSSLRMSSPATPPVIAGVAARRAGKGVRRGGGGARAFRQQQRGLLAAPRPGNVIGKVGRLPTPPTVSLKDSAAIINNTAGRQMFRQIVGSSSSSSSSSSVLRDNELRNGGARRDTGSSPNRRRREHLSEKPRSAYFPASPSVVQQVQNHASATATTVESSVTESTGTVVPAAGGSAAPASVVTLEGHHSFHEVEPRSRVPLPFALDGTPLLPKDEWVSHQQFHRARQRPAETTAPNPGRSATAHVLAHDRTLRFPSTLSILWDRTPLRTPVIIPHERLLPSLWVSSQTVQALGFAAQQQHLQQQSGDLVPARPVGLLIGRATFPGRSGSGANDEAATFLGESRPIVCLDMFDPGKTSPSKTTLQPTHDAVAEVEGIVMLPVSRGTLVPGTITATTASSSSPAWVSLGTGAVASHVLGLVRTCSCGGANGNIPTSSPVPGAGLWQIQCAVAAVSDEQEQEQQQGQDRSRQVPPSSTTTLLQLRMCLPAISLAFALIESLPLLQTPLTSMLLHPATCYSDATTDATTTDALLPTHGLLTLNQVRRAVPILADDAAAVGPHRLPMVGAWIRMPLDVNAIHEVPGGSGNGVGRGFIVPSPAIYEPASPAMHRVLTDPAVWAACCQYLYNPRLRRVTGVGGSSDAFLLCIFPEDPVRPGSPRNPIFLECSVVDVGSSSSSSSPSSSSTSAAFVQAGDTARPHMPVEMFQFSTQFVGNRNDAASAGRAQHVERVADTMVSCRFRPLSSRDTAAQRELADALDICTVRIGSAKVRFDPQIEEEGGYEDSRLSSVHDGLCGVSPSASTLAALSELSEDSIKYVNEHDAGDGDEVAGERVNEAELHHRQQGMQRNDGGGSGGGSGGGGDDNDGGGGDGDDNDEVEEEEPTLQIQGGDFSVEFEDYDEFQSFVGGAHENDDNSLDEGEDDEDDEDALDAIQWHRGQGTPRTSIEVTTQPIHRVTGLGEEKHTLPAPVFWEEDVRLRRSFANNNDKDESHTERTRRSHNSRSHEGTKAMRASLGSMSVEPQMSATPLVMSKSLSSSSSSFRQDFAAQQNGVQSRLAAHSVIASQQLEIRMLREQVEKLSVMVQRMDRQRQSDVTSSVECRTETLTKAGSAEHLHTRGSDGIHSRKPRDDNTPYPIEQVEKGGSFAGDDKTAEEGKEDDHGDVIQDLSPVDPMVRLSIPSFAEIIDDASRKSVDGKGISETEKPAATDDRLGEDRCASAVQEEQQQQQRPQRHQEGVPQDDDQRTRFVDSFVTIPRIVFDERYLTRGSSDDSEASFFESEHEVTVGGMMSSTRGRDSVKESSGEGDEEDSEFAVADPRLGRVGDVSSYQESDTIARIEAKYLKEGERTAVMNGASFAKEGRHGRRSRRGGRRHRRKTGRTRRGEKSAPEKAASASGSVLDRQRLLSMPKFNR